MVVRIVTGKSLKAALHYNEHKVQAGHASLLACHLFLQEPHALTFRDKLRRFERLLAKSPQVKTNAVHISLNFAVEEQLTPGRQEEIAARYMDKIGFGDQPYLVYQHVDAAHPHLHIVTTNIRPDGTRIDLHNIGRTRSEQARRELEQVFGLVQAEGRKRQELSPLVRLKKAMYGKSETKRTIAAIVTTVIRDYHYASLHELNAVLSIFGVQASRGPEGATMHRRGGLVYQMINDQGQKLGVPIKASAIPGKPTLAQLERRFSQNKAKQKQYAESLRRRIDRALRSPGINLEKFCRKLRKADIDVLFRKSAEGRTYGVTYIDHRQQVVLNGSGLGKDYGAKALLERLAVHTPATAVRPGLQENETSPSLKNSSETTAPLTSGVPPTGLVDLLWKAEQQPDYVPSPLRKRKKKKRKPHLR